MYNQFTSRLDLAQVILYAFWAFFFGLIYWLRKEDRREGYPLERDNSRAPSLAADFLIPAPKMFLLPHDEGVVLAPRLEAPSAAVLALPRPTALGAPIDPAGHPLLSAVGPAAYANRVDKPDKTREGHDLIVPMRIAEGFAVSAGPDPRGWDVIATDGKSAGKVKDLWVDRADVMVRYLEVELADESGTRLLPITMLLLRGEPRQVAVHAIRSEHFASVPTLKEPDRVTVLEEERICAFYAGGRRYAEPQRLGPLV